MEFLAVKALASLVTPPGLFAMLALGAALSVRRWPDLARRLCLACAGLILLLSSGPVSQALLDSLNRYPTIDPVTIKSAQAIVVLGAGAQRGLADYGGGTVTSLALERLRYGARLARDSGLPVLVTDGGPDGQSPGAQYMANTLLEFGVRARWIEGRALTTYDNARFARHMLAASGIERVALVSHSWHLPRAVAAFEQVGFQVLPAPTLVGAQRQPASLDWLPSASALERSTWAVHEYLGSAWYRLRYSIGW